MAIKNRNTLKSYFKTGAVPTEEDFAELIESMFVREEDNIATQLDGSIKITRDLTVVGSKQGLSVSADFESEKGVEFSNLDGTQGLGFGYDTIYAAGSADNQDLGLKARGTGKINIKSALSVSGDLTLPNNNLGIGTAEPKAKLHVMGGAIMPAGGGDDSCGIFFPPNVGGGGGDKAWMRYYARSGENMTLEVGISNDPEDHISLVASGNVGISSRSDFVPNAKLSIEQEVRTGTHPDSVKGLYVTADFEEAEGVEFRHSNGTQGIGFGYNTIYATGSGDDQNLGLKARGNGKIKIRSPLEAASYLSIEGDLRVSRITCLTEKISIFSRLEIVGDLTVSGTTSGPVNDYAKAQYTLSGGGTVKWYENVLSWSKRFIAMGMGSGSSFLNGHVSIDSPKEGTTLNVWWLDGGRTQEKVDGAGINLRAWDVLYAVHTIQGDEKAVEYCIVRWVDSNANFNVPNNWIFIALYNGDDGTLKLGTGHILRVGASLKDGVLLPPSVYFVAEVPDYIKGNHHPIKMLANTQSEGEHYKDGEFLVPFSGIYLFTVNIYCAKEDDSEGIATYWDLLVNDVEPSSIKQAYGLVVLSNNISCARTFILKLNGGDKVTIKQTAPEEYNTSPYFSGLSGVLISATL